MTNKYESLLNLGWKPIEDAPKDGTTFTINSGKALGIAYCSNPSPKPYEYEWFYNTTRSKGWTNNLKRFATHYKLITTPAEDEANRQKIQELIETVDVLTGALEIYANPDSWTGDWSDFEDDYLEGEKRWLYGDKGTSTALKALEKAKQLGGCDD